MMSYTERRALDELFSLNYEELRRLASGFLRNDRAAGVSPTTLVNECWLKLAPSPDLGATSPLHFRRIAGRAMRQVLVDAARKRNSQMRGCGQMVLTFDESAGIFPGCVTGRDILALDAALDELHRISPRQSVLVEARFFGGLSCMEAAAMLGVSEATVMREWRAARAWLAVEVRRTLTAPISRVAVPPGGGGLSTASAARA